MRAYAELVLFFVWRMIVWGIMVGLTVGALFGLLAIGLPLYEGGPVRDLVNVSVLGAILGSVSGAGFGLLCGIVLSALTLIFRSLPESIVRYRVISATLCSAILIGFTVLQFLLDSGSSYPVGSSAISILNAPLLIATPFCALVAQWVAKQYSERYAHKC